MTGSVCACVMYGLWRHFVNVFEVNLANTVFSPVVRQIKSNQIINLPSPCARENSTRCGAQLKYVHIVSWLRFECHFSEVRPGDIRRRRQLEICPIRAVLPACGDDTFYAHIDASAYCGYGSSGARGSRFDQSVRRSSRFNQSEQSSRHATRGTV